MEHRYTLSYELNSNLPRISGQMVTVKYCTAMSIACLEGRSFNGSTLDKFLSYL